MHLLSVVFSSQGKIPPGSVAALARLGDLVQTDRELAKIAHAYNYPPAIAHLHPPPHPPLQLMHEGYWSPYRWKRERELLGRRQQAARNIVNNVRGIRGRKKALWRRK
ncbi:hypothetical protein ElyMa_003168200 [Elysia marginata]|uniref:Uncharacterized protein n=1 Tax=Elysia marginata TaxID=1093978 RepID=A0AAV4J118_9GAST|nr:hypothetical protein ElyMa_003168200 [Elysia marginata]